MVEYPLHLSDCSESDLKRVRGRRSQSETVSRTFFKSNRLRLSHNSKNTVSRALFLDKNRPKWTLYKSTPTIDKILTLTETYLSPTAEVIFLQTSNSFSRTPNIEVKLTKFDRTPIYLQGRWVKESYWVGTETRMNVFHSVWTSVVLGLMVQPTNTNDRIGDYFLF